jgi:hypothetical protein
MIAGNPMPTPTSRQRPEHRLAWSLLVLAFALLVMSCSERLEWREVRYGGSPGGYTVLLPGRAQSVARDVVFEGRTLPVTMTSSGVGAAMFAVGVVQLPADVAGDAAARERAVAHFRDGLVHNIKGTVTASAPATLVLPAGSPLALRTGQALEARGTTGDGRATLLAARFFIVDDRLFQLVALGAEGSIAPQALETFFTSFRPTP